MQCHYLKKIFRFSMPRKNAFIKTYLIAAKILAVAVDFCSCFAAVAGH